MNSRVQDMSDPFLSPIFDEADPSRAVLGVIGLGYVGLPLAAAFALRGRRVIGYDLNAERVARIRAGIDETGEVARVDLQRALDCGLVPTADPDKLAEARIIMVCVPTPITRDRRPDLGPLLAACAILGPRLARGKVVIFESTVYPGVTEDVCGPALAEASGLVVGQDILLGYSPERVNPGDKAHRVETMVKVVAGQGEAVTRALGQLYGELNGDQIHYAPSIQVAEAAKAIENAQRDINIAFVNEVALICERIGLSVHDVLDAARTKWNFLDFKPGLVGGHCIGVDPYYLSYLSQSIGHEPDVILAGRRLNDHMADEVADRIAFRFREVSQPVRRPSALVLGAAFKEDVPDLRNSRTPQLVRRLCRHGFQVEVHDPWFDPKDLARAQDLTATAWPGKAFDLVVIAVGHRAFLERSPEALLALVSPGGMIADPKGLYRNVRWSSPVNYWTL
ncbi:nucleotide sugar dehydrogenase [Tistrella mobilis]|uniref:UDP-N-acetyl-D-mannosaminuronate dehydrogenase n=1 Tax=Tistrella mobilis (strain KA081020-065) TaxID=1110502 RepID=I3TIG1_TISMK|nr:nucleotide sugar dehydrogenase [Tistrella mobilis]AFK52549.1 UDP-N-acetyl-D-mannosaminuronate dehydrogenase [Tistrella mobilis KA081020-065]